MFEIMGDVGGARELGSAVAALRSERLSDLPDARIEEDFSELQRVCERLEVERLRRLAELDRRRVFERDGLLSAVAWLVSKYKFAWGAARDQVRLARSLERMPRTLRALEEGAVSLSAARVLVQAREVNPEAFSRSEAQLVEAARIHTINGLNRAAAYWRQMAEQESGLGEEQVRARRSLHASVSFLGMVRVDGDLDPENGETLMTALRAVIDAEVRSGARDDERSPAQRRADALGEICRQWLDRGDRPSVAGERPHLSVTVGADQMGSRTGMAELDHSGPVDIAAARRLGCDASVMRVVLAGASEPLDVGRRTQVVPPSIRRAVIVRDRHCRFPGCDRPHTWCDAHHIEHWADGGETSPANLLLLCRRHHRLSHDRGGFRLKLEEGRPVFRRPDGSVLEDRGPP
jgi:hypothetical protein